jgi:hypothetical protein
MTDGEDKWWDQYEDLPVIRIVSEEEDPHVKLGLEMEDTTKAMLAQWGREVASDDDYVEIAIREGLTNFVKEQEKKDEQS